MNQECINCNSENTIKNGLRKNKYEYAQIRICKDCNTKFTARQFKKIHYNAETIAECLELYYRGFSLRAISDFFLKTKNIKVSHTTILDYLKKGILRVKEFTDTLVPQTGKVLLADETMITCREAYGNKAWIWNVMDEESRFLLTNHLSFTRTQYHANETMKEAASFTNGETEKIITDGLLQYPKAIKMAFSKAKHQQYLSIKLSPNNNQIESYHSTLKNRYKSMKGFSRLKSSQILMWGWQIYFNYIKPHSKFKGNTPASVSQINLPYPLSWKKLLELSEETTAMIT